jgi:hypothetical protein
MHLRWIWFFGAMATLVACETKQPLQWIAGPSVLPVPTTRLYNWDSRDELAIWINNPVSQGSFSLQGEGPGEFIRVRMSADEQVVLRGPDLIPPVAALRGVRLRYRWIADDLSEVSSGGGLGSVQPVAPAWPAVLTGHLQSATWRDANLTVVSGASERTCGGPCPGAGGTVDSRYVYFNFRGIYGRSSQLDIDSIVLVH